MITLFASWILLVQETTSMIFEKLELKYLCIWLSRSEQDKEPEAEASSDVVGNGPTEEPVADGM